MRVDRSDHQTGCSQDVINHPTTSQAEPEISNEIRLYSSAFFPPRVFVVWDRGTNPAGLVQKLNTHRSRSLKLDIGYHLWRKVLREQAGKLLRPGPFLVSANCWHYRQNQSNLSRRPARLGFKNKLLIQSNTKSLHANCPVFNIPVMDGLKVENERKSSNL